MPAPLLINFPNPIARKHFMQWLGSSHAEDGYSIWMDECEYRDKDTKELTILRKRIDYKNGIIETECGRMDSR
jgi:hypothetical protein